MSVPSNDLAKWVKKIMIEVQEDGGATRVELWHAIEGEGGDRIATFKNLSEHTADDLGEAIWETAESDAKTRTAGMIQRYSCQAFVGSDDGDGMPEQMHAFTMRGGQSGDLFGDDTEPGTPQGRMKMDMRHTENLHRLLVQQTEMTSGRLARDYAEERKARIAAENRSLDVIKIYQDLLDRQSDRDLKTAKEIQSEKRTDQMIGMLMTIAPLVIARFVPALGGQAGSPAGGQGGSPLTPQASLLTGPLLQGSPRSIMLGKILLSIPGDKARALISSLSQMTQIAVMQIIASYQESPPGADKFQDDARDIAIANFLKNLPHDELMTILVALDKDQQQAFLAVYKSYSAEEQKIDAERPDILKNQPTGNGKSHGGKEDEEAQGPEAS